MSLTFLSPLYERSVVLWVLGPHATNRLKPPCKSNWMNRPSVSAPADIERCAVLDVVFGSAHTCIWSCSALLFCCSGSLKMKGGVGCLSVSGVAWFGTRKKVKTLVVYRVYATTVLDKFGAWCLMFQIQSKWRLVTGMGERKAGSEWVSKS